MNFLKDIARYKRRVGVNNNVRFALGIEETGIIVFAINRDKRKFKSIVLFDTLLKTDHPAALVKAEIDRAVTSLNGVMKYDKIARIR